MAAPAPPPLPPDDEGLLVDPPLNLPPHDDGVNMSLFGSPRFDPDVPVGAELDFELPVFEAGDGLVGPSTESDAETVRLGRQEPQQLVLPPAVRGVRTAVCANKTLINKHLLSREPP